MEKVKRNVCKKSFKDSKTVFVFILAWNLILYYLFYSHFILAWKRKKKNPPFFAPHFGGILVPLAP